MKSRNGLYISCLAILNRRLLLIVLGLFLALEAVGEPRFCAVGWYGEFTHISDTEGQIEPTSYLPVNHLQAMAWSPEGVLYAGGDASIYKIDPITGNTQKVYAGPWDLNIRGMAFNAAGELYVINALFSTSELGKINLKNNIYTKINNFSGSWPQGLAFSPQGQLYGICPATGVNYELATIDVHTAQTTTVGVYPDSFCIDQSLEFLPDGSLYALGTQHFAQISPIDGSIIGQVHELAGDFRGLAVIPEPGMLLLFGLGSMLLRKRKLA